MSGAQFCAAARSVRRGRWEPATRTHASRARRACVPHRARRCCSAAMAAARAITHVIFDMDGLLLDTETAYTTAQAEVCARYGKKFTWELKAKMMGKKALESAQLLLDELQLGGQLSAEAFLSEREVLLDALLPRAALLPGAERLLRHLSRAGVPIALATSSHRRHYDVKTAAHAELFGLFDVTVTGDMVQQGKPHPEIFERAAAGFAAPPASPAHCLVFEDAPSGVLAAAAAGMAVIMVPDPQLDAALVAELPADQVLRSLQDFAASAWGLPPMDGAGCDA